MIGIYECVKNNSSFRVSREQNRDRFYYARFLETNFLRTRTISGTNMYTAQVCNSHRVCGARAWFLANLLRKRRRVSEDDKERKQDYRKVHQKIHLERTDSLYLIVRTAVHKLQFSNTSHSKNCAYPASTWSSWIAKIINAMYLATTACCHLRLIAGWNAKLVRTFGRGPDGSSVGKNDLWSRRRPQQHRIWADPVR